MTTTTAPSDLEIQRNVQNEMAWSADVDRAGIGVAVVDGVVTLSGDVAHAAGRRTTVRAALRTRGVRAVVDELVVRPNSAHGVGESEIAARVADAMRWSWSLPDSVHASVDGHTVTLTGHVEWHYQRENARRAVEDIRGVVTVDNEISLRPRASAVDADRHIHQALVRTALLDADRIVVTVDGNTVTLTGLVHSFAERMEAEAAAWSSPHVTDVRDFLTVTG